MRHHTTRHRNDRPARTLQSRRILFMLTAEILDKDGRLRVDGFMTLGQLCQLQIDIANLQETLRKTGLTQLTDRGQTQTRVEVSTLNQARTHFRSLLAQFGLTPRSRSGCGLTFRQVLKDFLRSVPLVSDDTNTLSAT